MERFEKAFVHWQTSAKTLSLRIRFLVLNMPVGEGVNSKVAVMTSRSADHIKGTTVICIYIVLVLPCSRPTNLRFDLYIYIYIY